MTMRKLIPSALIIALVLAMTCMPAAMNAESERPTITYGSKMEMNTDKPYYPTEFVLYFQDLLGANIEFIKYDNDTEKLALASGDLPDLMMAQQASAILEGNLAVALDPYLEEYGQNILKYEARNTIIRDLVSGGDGQLYFHTPNSGVEDQTGGLQTWNGYLVRWDLYKQIGAPAITGDDDYIAVLKQLVAENPSTDAGLPVYGMGLHGSDQWAWNIRAMANGGYSNTSSWAYAISTVTTEISSNYLEPDSPFWSNMAFYNKLNREGLLDPDSFTMTSEEVQEKAANNQYVGGYCVWYTDKMYNTNRLTDPQTLAGIIPVYGEGLSGWYGSNHKVGWGDKLTFITTAAKDPVLAVKFINLLDSDELNRVHYSGVEGMTWNYNEAGVPKLTEEAVALKSAGGDPWDHVGIGSFSNTIGSSGFGVAPDGAFYSLWDDPDLKYAQLSVLQKDYADFYGVKYPSEVHYNLVKEGKAVNQSNNKTQAVQLGLAQRPDDINRIDARIDEIVNRAIPAIVNAETDEAFQAAKDKLISDLKGAEAETAWQWWDENWNGVLARVNELLGE
jgi:hypothetical protein